MYILGSHQIKVNTAIKIRRPGGSANPLKSFLSWTTMYTVSLPTYWEICLHCSSLWYYYFLLYRTPPNPSKCCSYYPLGGGWRCWSPCSTSGIPVSQACGSNACTCGASWVTWYIPVCQGAIADFSTHVSSFSAAPASPANANADLPIAVNEGNLSLIWIYIYICKGQMKLASIYEKSKVNELRTLFLLNFSSLGLGNLWLESAPRLKDPERWQTIGIPEIIL